MPRSVRWLSVPALTAMVLTLLLAPGTTPAPAAAATSFRYWYGTVVKVYDGDTVEVKLDSGKTIPVRNGEIQALELKHPTNNLKANECHSVAAKKLMTSLVMGKQVRLSAEHVDSTSQGRPVRFVDVNTGTQADPVWEDVQEKMLKAGLALWKPERSREPAHNAEYHVDAEEAMRKGIGIYDTDSCNPGPRQDSNVSMFIQWNGYSVTAQKSTVNGEYVRVFNPSDKALSVAGWVLRDATHVRHFKFPKGTKIPAHGNVVVRAGSGKDTSRTFYWGLASNPFHNAVYGVQGWPGDGLYLVDKDGDYRTWFVYPCSSDCTDPLQGKVQIQSVNWDAEGNDAINPNGEWVKLLNTSYSAIDLSWYVIENPPYTKVIPGGTVLKAGESLVLKMGSGRTTLGTSPVKLYLGSSSGVLNNTGDVVRLRTFSDISLDCYAWGNHKGDC